MSPLLAHNIYLVDLPLLIVLTSLVYSATRYEHWTSILYEAVRWGLRLALFMLAIVAVLFVADRL
jgi:hypothetical protein